MSLDEVGHEAVLMRETLDLLGPRSGSVIVDCTVGRGGHSLEILKRVGPTGLLIGVDVDERNLAFAQSRLAGVEGTARLFHANFSELAKVLDAAGVKAVDGILADLGVSTNQLFDERYGLSFVRPGPLDMRLDSRGGPTAADLVNSMGENALADVLYQLAQERYSRKIARKICEARRISPITTTDRLAELVRSAIPTRGGAPEKIDPATRTFLALRMQVNQEPQNLLSLLREAPRWLKSGGRLAIISFQSSEDREVKQAFRSAEQTGLVRVVTKKPLSPAESELAANPRSRSAKLRVVERTSHPAD